MEALAHTGGVSKAAEDSSAAQPHPLPGAAEDFASLGRTATAPRARSTTLQKHYRKTTALPFPPEIQSLVAHEVFVQHHQDTAQAHDQAIVAARAKNHPRYNFSSNIHTHRAELERARHLTQLAQTMPLGGEASAHRILREDAQTLMSEEARGEAYIGLAAHLPKAQVQAQAAKADLHAKAARITDPEIREDILNRLEHSARPSTQVSAKLGAILIPKRSEALPRAAAHRIGMRR